MNLFLRRIAETPDATFGILHFDGVPRLVTLELPWRNNQRNVSRIPLGSYQLARVQSQRFGNTFEVKNVPERSAILFHAGNIPADTQGCILVGARFGAFEYSRISDSGDAMLIFRRFLRDTNSATLEIVDDIWSNHGTKIAT